MTDKIWVVTIIDHGILTCLELFPTYEEAKVYADAKILTSIRTYKWNKPRSPDTLPYHAEDSSAECDLWIQPREMHDT